MSKAGPRLAGRVPPRKRAGGTTRTKPRNRTPNASGVHLLRDSRVALALTRAAPATPGSLVLDLGAGLGALTTPLARTGARVIAVERDPSFVRALRKRFDGWSDVRVVEADVRDVPLPRRTFTVAANIPFAISTPLLRRLLDGQRHGFAAAELLVEWGFANRVTAPCPRDLETAWWAARFELRIVRRVPARSFTPAPRVDAAHLTIRRRPGIDPATERCLGSLLAAVYAAPSRPASQVVKVLGTGKRTHRLLTSSGIDPPTPAGDVPIRNWYAATRVLGRS